MQRRVPFRAGDRSFALAPGDVTTAKLALFAAIHPARVAVRHPATGSEEPVDGNTWPDVGAPYVVFAREEPHDAAAQSAWTSLGITRSQLRAQGRTVGRFALLRVPVHTRDVLVLDNGRDELAALDATCYHYGGPLSLGDIEDVGDQCILTCPWHRYQIDVRTGHSVSRSLHGQPSQSAEPMQRVHRARVNDATGMVEVQLLLDGEVASDHYAVMGLYASLEAH